MALFRARIIGKAVAAFVGIAVYSGLRS